MITMRIKGGLGNQLFQYAVAYALSKRLNQPFRFDPSFTGNMTARSYKILELNCNVDSIVEEEQLPIMIRFLKNAYINKACRLLNLSKHRCGNYIYWIETKDVWQADFLKISCENLYVDGYFQSEEYFKKYRADLLKQFTPRYEPEQQYLTILERVRKKNTVAVHVRRGDFKKDNNPFHYLLDANYYRRAVEYIREKVDNPEFFWFSDDMIWVKEHIGEMDDFHFVTIRTTHGDIDDMMLMKNCNHIITANSTFSWWAAWLNENDDSIRIVPQKPYGMDGMIPNGWMRI